MLSSDQTFETKTLPKVDTFLKTNNLKLSLCTQYKRTEQKCVRGKWVMSQAVNHSNNKTQLCPGGGRTIITKPKILYMFYNWVTSLGNFTKNTPQYLKSHTQHTMFVLVLSFVTTRGRTRGDEMGRRGIIGETVVVEIKWGSMVFLMTSPAFSSLKEKNIQLHSCFPFM